MDTYKVLFERIGDPEDISEIFETKDEAVKRAKYLSKIKFYTNIRVFKIHEIKW